MFTADIEGLEELKAEWAEGCDELGRDLETTTLLAAKDGIERAKTVHPYTDRTGNLTGEAHANALARGAAMVWGMTYASFVDQGTSRSRPYPFTPGAVAVAEESLDVHANAAVEKLCDWMNR